MRQYRNSLTEIRSLGRPLSVNGLGGLSGIPGKESGKVANALGPPYVSRMATASIAFHPPFEH